MSEFKRQHGDVWVDLDRVAEAEGRQFVDELLDTEPNLLGEGFRHALFRHTRGHPLFTSEVLRSLQERGELVHDEAGRWVKGPALDWRALPARVEGVIERRIGRLKPGLRTALTIASVEGEDFTAEVVARVQGMDERGLIRRLSGELDRQHRLVSASGIRRVGAQRLSRYRFRHNLFQKYLYNRLDEVERTYLHEDVGNALEALYGEQTDEIAVQLGRHFQQAGAADKAIRYLLEAGDQARQLYAHRAAINHYAGALALLKEQGQHEQAARTLMKLGLTHHGAFDFQRARQAYAEGFAMWQQAWESMSASRQQPADQALRVTWPHPQTLDPAMCMDIFTGGVIDQLFSGLAEPGPEMDVVPAVARTWEMLEGGSKYIFHLRDDVDWSDGTPVTAGDFEYAWKRVLDGATGAPYAHYLYDIKGARAYHQSVESDPDSVGVRALDQGTLIVELEGPVAYFLHLLTFFITYPVPRHVVEAHGEMWTDVGSIATNGPFSLEEWQPGQSFVLSRNPAYRGRFTGNVQRVEVSLREQWSIWAEVVEMYEADGLDMLASYMNIELGAKQRHAGEYVTGPWPGTLYVGFDVRRPPFDDPRVRRAFALATDKETLVNVVLGGHVYPGTGGLVPPGMPGYSAGIGLSNDPAGARQLLTEAGYPKGDGFPAIGLETNRGHAFVGQHLRARWRDVLGVEIAGEALEWPLFLDRLNNDPPRLFLLGMPAFYPDPDSFLRASFFRRYTGWHSDAYVELVEQARRTMDRRERMEIYRQADRTLVEEAAIIPVAYGRLHLLVKPWVKRLPTSANKWWFWKDVIIEPH